MNYANWWLHVAQAGEAGPGGCRAREGWCELTHQAELASDGAETQQSRTEEQQRARLRRGRGAVVDPSVIIERLIEKALVQNDVAALKRIVTHSSEPVEIVEREIGVLDTEIRGCIEVGEIDRSKTARVAGAIDREHLQRAGVSGPRRHENTKSESSHHRCDTNQDIPFHQTPP